MEKLILTCDSYESTKSDLCKDTIWNRKRNKLCASLNHLAMI